MTKRPEALNGLTRKIAVGCGTLYVTINFKDDDRYNEPPINEVFIEPSFKDREALSCIKTSLMPLARMITFAIRHEDSGDKDKYRANLIKQLLHHECPKQSVVTAKSCVDAVARVLLCQWKGHQFKEGRCWVCKLRKEEK